MVIAVYSVNGTTLMNRTKQLGQILSTLRARIMSAVCTSCYSTSPMRTEYYVCVFVRCTRFGSDVFSFNKFVKQNVALH